MDEDIGPGLDERHIDALKERVRSSPFHQWAGLELVSVGDGTAELRMVLRPHHFNPQGIVHGGIITAVADSAIGLALRSRLPAGLTHRTAQLNVHFLTKGEAATWSEEAGPCTRASGWAMESATSWTAKAGLWPERQRRSSSCRPRERSEV